MGDDLVIDVQHETDDDAPTKAGMRYQRGVFRSWPPEKRPVLVRYWVAHHLPEMRRERLFRALVIGCGLALLLTILTSLSGCTTPVWVPDEMPIAVEFHELDQCQRQEAMMAMRLWADAIGVQPTEMWFVHEDATGMQRDWTIRISSEEPQVGAVADAIPWRRDALIRIGAHCASRITQAHELGHMLLGLAHDDEPHSLMAPGTGETILPRHVEEVRELLGLPPLAQATQACAQEDHYRIARYLELWLRPRCLPARVTYASITPAFEGEVL